MTNTRPLSDEEIHFEWFLEELKELGFIKDYSYESETITVTEDAFQIREIDPLKRKTKVVYQDKFLIPSTTYTPDYVIEWDESAKDIFYLDIHDYEYFKQSLQYVPFFAEHGKSLVEVKPSHDQNNMTRAFMLKRASLSNNILKPKYINLVKMPMFFKTYCMPARYELTDKTGKARKINFDYSLISEYIPFMESLNKELEEAYKKKV